MAYTAVDEIPGIVAGLHETYKSGVTRCRSQNMLGLFRWKSGLDDDSRCDDCAAPSA